ncbi:ATP-grasp domain-containing protein [Jatrophihabitans sp.]|jgi:biotin carboxylase|uniref:ATP-grasp domain-containing protein n=1 Tax=Jatrophihabitans sp. TaxID=1932789 RepID=UPI002F1BB815
MSEHVLIFGNGYYIPDRLRTWAASTGQTVSTSVLCQPEQLAKIDEPEKHARIIALPPEAPLEEWIAYARVLHEIQPVTRIGAFSDQCQDIAAEVGLVLGIPTHSPETVRLVHDKYAMRQRLAEAGVESTPSAVVTAVAQLREFAATHGYPCVVKPLSGMASSGVSVISEAAEAAAAFARARASDPRAHGTDTTAQATGNPPRVVVETFLPGVQYSVESFSEHGEHQVVIITRKYSDAASLVELGHVMPALLDPGQRNAIEAHVCRVLEALGVRFGPTHTEIILTEAGPRVIETHLRFGGDQLWNLVTDATGVDLVRCQWRQVIGETVLPGIRELLDDPSRAPRCEAIWFAGAPSAGILVEVQGADGPQPDGVTVDLLASPGSELNGLQNSHSRLAQARAHAGTAADALALAQQAIERLEFLVRVPNPQSELL